MEWVEIHQCAALDLLLVHLVSPIRDEPRRSEVMIPLLEEPRELGDGAGTATVCAETFLLNYVKREIESREIVS